MDGWMLSLQWRQLTGMKGLYYSWSIQNSCISHCSFQPLYKKVMDCFKGSNCNLHTSHMDQTTNVTLRKKVFGDISLIMIMQVDFSLENLSFIYLHYCSGDCNSVGFLYLTWLQPRAYRRTEPPPWRSHRRSGVDSWSSVAALQAAEPARYTAPEGRSQCQCLEKEWREDTLKRTEGQRWHKWKKHVNIQTHLNSQISDLLRPTNWPIIWLDDKDYICHWQLSAIFRHIYVSVA